MNLFKIRIHNMYELVGVVLQNGIFGWYWLVFSCFFTNQYQRKTWLVHFRIKKLAGAPFSLQKRGLWTPFGALSPHFEGKRVSRGLKNNVPKNFKKEFPPNPTVQKIPTGYTNQLVLVPYQYQPDGR
jgi:hypothetical protein